MGYFDGIDANTLEGRVRILNILYASEIVAAEQYWAHGVAFSGPNSLSVQAMLYEHADEEMKHAKMLLDRIHNMGGMLKNTLSGMVENFKLLDPHGDVVLTADTKKIYTLNLTAEETAIEAYTEACTLFRDVDPASWIVVAQILGDEFEHAQELKNLMG